MRARSLTRGAVVAGIGLLAALIAVVGLSAPASAAGGSVWLTRANGANVPENGVVKTGESITVHVKGFAPNATVLLQFAAVQLPSGVDTDASGAGSIAYTVPALRSDAYVVTASSDSDVATFVVTLVNPKNPKPTATPKPTPSPSKSTGTGSTGSSGSSGSHGSSGSSGSGSTSGGSSSGTLAKTGSTQPAYWAMALALLVVGAGLVKVAAPVLLGRHERVGGAHVRVPGRRLRD